jgi:hypothetical protein
MLGPTFSPVDRNRPQFGEPSHNGRIRGVHEGWGRNEPGTFGASVATAGLHNPADRVTKAPGDKPRFRETFA